MVLDRVQEEAGHLELMSRDDVDLEAEEQGQREPRRPHWKSVEQAGAAVARADEAAP
jgi:hypothetical protein